MVQFNLFIFEKYGDQLAKFEKKCSKEEI